MKAGKIKRHCLQAMTMRSKLLLIFGITWLVAIAVVSCVAINGQIDLEKGRVIQEHIGRLSDIKQACDGLIESVNLVSIRLAYDENVAALLDDSYTALTEEAQKGILLEVGSLLGQSGFVANFNRPESLFLIAPDGRVYSNNYTFMEVCVLRDALLAQIREREAPKFGYLLEQDDASGQILHIRRIRLRGSEYGLAVLVLLRSEIASICSSYYPGGRWSFFDQTGTLIAAADRGRATIQDYYNLNLSDYTLKQSAHEVSDAAGKGFMTCLQSDNPNRFYAIYTDNAEIFDSCGTIIVTVVLIAALALGVLLYLSWYLSQRLVKPLDKLEQLMNCVEKGDYTVRMNPRFDDEVARLGRHFDRMVMKTHELVQNNRTIEKEKRRDELKILQLQINPHFLYNTLSSIIWLANENRKNEVIDITKSLAIYYRLALSSGREVVPVRDEILHAKNYINIQLYRYQDEFTVEYAFAPEIDSYTMPKLILQPLLENAIYHGVKNRETPGAKIRIAGRVEADCLVFEVADNGSGLEEEALQTLNESLRTNQALGVGTSNVNRRIILRYGETYGLRFARENGWTIARVRLPIRPAQTEPAGRQPEQDREEDHSEV